MPTSTLNYSLALSHSVSVTAFSLATIGNWPGLGFWLYFGAAFGSRVSADNRRSGLNIDDESFVWVLGLFFAIITLAFIVYMMGIEAKGAQSSDVEMGAAADVEVKEVYADVEKSIAYTGPVVKVMGSDQETTRRDIHQVPFAIRESGESGESKTHFNQNEVMQRADWKPDPRPPISKRLVQTISKRASRDQHLQPNSFGRPRETGK